MIFFYLLIIDIIWSYSDRVWWIPCVVVRGRKPFSSWWSFDSPHSKRKMEKPKYRSPFVPRRSSRRSSGRFLWVPGSLPICMRKFLLVFEISWCCDSGWPAPTRPPGIIISMYLEYQRELAPANWHGPRHPQEVSEAVLRARAGHEWTLIFH